MEKPWQQNLELLSSARNQNGASVVQRVSMRDLWLCELPDFVHIKGIFF